VGTSWYDVMQVCRNGHKITGQSLQHPEDMRKKCPICGEGTITECPACGSKIQGYKHTPGFMYPDNTKPPKFCHNCGKRYPWAKEIPPDVEDKKNQPLVTLLRMLSRFHLVEKQLRKRHAGRSSFVLKDEYDVQDLLRAILTLDFDDIRPEEWVPSYAGSSSRVDFLLKNHRIILEVKKTRPGLTDSQIGEQLIVDIARYSSHPDCQTLVCFIYDPQRLIANPVGLRTDLQALSTQGPRVIVCICPE
jgi:hypothetical protein